jgi:DNA excision repair protein ERCC-3
VFNYEKGRLDDQGHELLKIEMVPKAKPRDYQEQALKNVFRNGIASSGVIVLPCGAGKTLVGILIMNQIKRSTIILCDRDVTV